MTAAAPELEVIAGAVIERPMVGHSHPFRALVLRDCTFARCALGPPSSDDVARTRPVEVIRIERARTKNLVRLDRLAFRDVVVDGCQTDRPVRVVNCLFDRVVLRGDVGGVHVSSDLFTPDLRSRHAAFYAEAEWALDIREARFADAIFRGIPIDKIRRDPARQFVLHKARVRADASWRKLSKPLVNRLEFWLSLPGELELLVASDLSPRFELELERYHALRQAGFLD